MIELPEAVALAKQIKATLKGKKIASAIAGYSPHKFAWYHGDPKNYGALLKGKTIDNATSYGGQLEVWAGDARMLFSDGVVLRYLAKGEKRPPQHQLLIEFEDGTAVSASVQMYGGLSCFKEGTYQNKYYIVAREKPSPLTDKFDWAYFSELINNPEVQKLSAKAFLATEQRIPGLGNGVLQDILYNAKIHPKEKVGLLTDNQKKTLFNAVKSTLKEMTEQGGRDNTKDIFGKPGGYKTKLSQLTMQKPCPVCGGTIFKQPYMGGSIYFCNGCQKMWSVN
jgi:formamidopyrimidine-DNA glycosylase